MNQLKKQLICLTALVSATHLFGDGGTTSKIIPRSQSFNAARQIVSWDNYEWGIHRKPQDNNYASFNLAFEYTRSFRDNRLARALFGNDLICSSCDDSAIKISGSAVPNRGATDWLADYFGLPRDFQSTVSFNPRIQNYILEFSFYAGLDEWFEGAYFKIYGPFVHTKWNLNAEECTSNGGTAYNGYYFQGYFTDNVVPMSNLNNNFLSYANGATPTNLTESYESESIVWQPLCCSKISPECGCDGQGLTRNGFGELRFVLGYDFVNDDKGDYHAGLGIYVAAPTGTRVGDQDDCNSKGRYLFEPIVGNGKHWELGAQVTAHSIFWRNEEETKSLGLYIEANVTHLFGANQIRCFDLCSAGSNSRYMLAEKLVSNSTDIVKLPQTVTVAGNVIAIDTLGLEFGNVYAPVANITRSNVVSTIGAQGDVAFSFAYQSGNFQWDLGYNFWGISCEKLSLKGCCNPAFGQWALKGDQRVFGFDIYGQAYSLPVTDSQATIHSGSNLANKVDYTEPNPTAPVNFYADNSQTLGILHPPVHILPTDTIAIYTSEPPVLIKQSDFDLDGTRGISNKIFTHFNYAWPEMKDSKWTPYVGLGFEAEFGSGNGNCCEDDCNTSCAPNVCNYGTNTSTTLCTQLKPNCSNVAVSQWGIWFKVGTSYN